MPRAMRRRAKDEDPREKNELVVGAMIAHAYLAGARSGNAPRAGVGTDILPDAQDIDAILDAPPRGFDHALRLAEEICDAVRREPRSAGEVLEDARGLSNRVRGLVDSFFGGGGGGSRSRR